MLSFNNCRDKELLSTRSRILIRLHHLVLIGFIGWIGYLFAVRELL